MTTHGLYLLALPAVDDQPDHRRAQAIAAAVRSCRIPGLHPGGGHCHGAIAGQAHQLSVLVSDTAYVAPAGNDQVSYLDLARTLHQIRALLTQLLPAPDLAGATCYYGPATALPTAPGVFDPTADCTPVTTDLEATYAAFLLRRSLDEAPDESTPPDSTPGLFPVPPRAFTDRQPL